MARPEPAELGGLVPHLTVDGAHDAIEFYVVAFGASERDRIEAPDGRVSRAALAIGDALFFLSDAESGEDEREASAAIILHRFVLDVDGAFGLAVSAGARPVVEPMRAADGGRYAVVADPWGHRWSFSSSRAR
jgi:PhnB protein